MVVHYLNGKYTARRTTGVERVAACLVSALDAHLDAHLAGHHARHGERWVLLHPAGAEPPALRNIETRAVGWRGMPLHLWEQIALPLAARGGMLLSLGGSAPWLVPRQTVMLHDAAVFDHPQAYALSFRVWYRRLHRHLARSGAVLLTVSVFSRGRLVEHLRVPPERIAVIPNAADHLDAVQADAGIIGRLGLAGTPFLLAVASANPSKNLTALVEAFARLADCPPVRLVIVGAGNARVFASDAPAADPPGLLRAGPLPDADLKALYQHATALVFPSLYEGFGLPPLEAMTCGCPVAAARAAAIPEVCGDAALYFDPLDVDDITRALQRMLGDVELSERLGRLGTERAAHFSWAESARLLLAALEAGHSNRLPR